MTIGIGWARSTQGREGEYTPVDTPLTGLSWLRVSSHHPDASGGIVTNLVTSLDVTILKWNPKDHVYDEPRRGVEDDDFAGQPVQFFIGEREWVPADYVWVSYYLIYVPPDVVARIKFNAGTAAEILTAAKLPS